MDNKYQVTLVLPFVYTVQANSEEEAEDKARELFDNEDLSNLEFDMTTQEVKPVTRDSLTDFCM